MKQQIEKFIENVFLKLNIDIKYLRIEESNRKELADYQINSVFSIAKETFRNPKDVGEEIVNAVNKLDNFNDYFKSVTFCLPGFINIKVSNKLLNNYLNKVINEGNLGIEKIKSNILYFLDYGGPNIAKPLHVGHLRPAIIGESVNRILKIKGYKTISDAHFGDFGLQMGQVIYGIIRDNITKEEINIEYLNKIYPEMSKLCKEDENILNECKRITKELQENNSEYLKYLDKIIEVSLTDIKRLYKYLGVSFDLWLGERDSFPYVKHLIDYLNEKNLVILDDGAYIIDIKKDTDTKEIPPLILLNSSGATMYSTTDLATIYDRVHKYNIDHMLYFTDFRQEMHFEQVFRACDKSELFPYEKLEHIKNGTINGSDNKPFKTRSGDTLKLDDLITQTKEVFISKKESNKNMLEKDLDKIVNAIIKFADLSNSRDKNYIFDLSKFSDVNGKTGPYILYTALRIKKLLAENKYETVSISENIYNDNDRSLRMKLLELDNVIEKSIINRYPHFIAEYLYELSNITNTFYQNNNILNLKDENQKNDWLNLLSFAYNVIETCLNLLVIEIPTRM